jgi:glycosyltransferase involved in cell wall biosynthesis
MSDKVITVIIPVYNREKYLDKCINSVLDQANVNTEIILVDDGSADRSPEICDNYAKKYDNIVVIHSDNHGVSHARNLALDKTTGDYLTFLDSDDRLAPGALSILLNNIEKNATDYVVGGFEQFTDEGELSWTSIPPEIYSDKILDKRAFLDMMIYADHRLVMRLTSKLFRTDFWKDLRFPENVTNSEDDYLLAKILKRTNRVSVTCNTVYLQTLSDVSLNRKAPTINRLNTSNSILETLDYIIELGNIDVALFRFGDGTRKLIFSNRILHSKEAKKEVKRQYKGFRNIAKKLLPYVDTKTKIRLHLYRLNHHLYAVIRDLCAS